MSWFASLLGIFSRSWNRFNLVVGFRKSVSQWLHCVFKATDPWEESLYSRCKVPALPAIVVIQVTEVDKGMPWITIDLFSILLVCDVSLLCWTALMTWFPSQPWIWAIHLSPLSPAITQAVKPYECHEPPLIFSSIKKLCPPLSTPTPSCWALSNSSPVIERKMAGSPLHAVAGLANMLVSSSILLFRKDRIRFQDLKSGPIKLINRQYLLLWLKGLHKGKSFLCAVTWYCYKVSLIHHVVGLKI